MSVSIKYAAGFFDAEGSVGIHIYPKTGQASLRVSVANTCGSVLEALRDRFGGCVSSPHVGKQGWKPRQNLILSHQKAEDFLRAVAPFLCIKRPQAVLGLAFREFQKLPKSERCDKAHSPTGKIPFRYIWKKKKETVEKEFSYKSSMAFLNERGKASFWDNAPVFRNLSMKYTAGFFDGEGCVSFIRTNSYKSLVLRIVITNTHPGILESLQLAFGGYVRRPCVRKQGWRATRYLYIGQRLSRNFLEEVIPFSRVKRRQIKLALLFLKFRELPPSRRYVWRQGAKGNLVRMLSPCSVYIGNWFERRLHKLNKRGYSQWQG